MVKKFDLFAYQIEAVEKSTVNCLRHGGCAIWHQTGLGKTIIGAYTANNLGENILVISPKNNQKAWVDILPHATIVTKQAVPNKPFDVILIDEAHNFGNHKNKSYQDLVRAIYLQGQDKFPYVLLMSATPINNNIGELYDMLRLIPFKTNSPLFYILPNLFYSTVKKEKELKNKNRYTNDSFGDILEITQTEIDFNKNLETIGQALNLFSVRETRQGITKKYPMDIKLMGMFPTILKNNVSYNIDYKLTLETIKIIESMPFAYYNYLNYTEKPKKNGFAGIMKCLLFKRLDSSTVAFKATLDKILATIQHVEFENNCVKINSEWIGVNSSFIEDNANDIKALCSIKKLWNDTTDLDKLNQLENIVKNATGKIVIFSEYQSSKDLIASFLSKYKVISFDSKNEKDLDTISQNFDANSDTKKNNFNILVTTDVLSEGVNLHEADTLIHFDMKWNPSRLAQREGRIDRIIKNINFKIKTVNIFTFGVDSVVESIIKLENKITHKSNLSELLLNSESYKFYPKLKKGLWYKDNKNISDSELICLNFNEGSIIFSKKAWLSTEIKLFDGDLVKEQKFLGAGLRYNIKNVFVRYGEFGIDSITSAASSGIYEHLYKIKQKENYDYVLHNFCFMFLLNSSSSKRKGIGNVDIEGKISERFFENFLLNGIPYITESTTTLFESNKVVINNNNENIIL